MASKAPDFPVRVTKGTGKDKVTRTAHSPISLAQLRTEGFNVEKVRTASDDGPKADGPKADGNKTASK